jgi:hypothetical protein
MVNRKNKVGNTKRDIEAGKDVGKIDGFIDK